MPESASSSAAWMVGALSCRCQPPYSVPSYSIVSLRLRGSLTSEFKVHAGEPGEVADAEALVAAEAGHVGVGQLGEEAGVLDAELALQVARGRRVDLLG